MRGELRLGNNIESCLQIIKMLFETTKINPDNYHWVVLVENNMQMNPIVMHEEKEVIRELFLAADINIPHCLTPKHYIAHHILDLVNSQHSNYTI